MKCPYCGHLQDKVVDSRESREGEVIRRRRECLECGRRFTSYERVDEIPYMVVKKDGRRERFDRQKLIAGLLKACEKRPVRVNALEAVADRVESALQERPDKEISTTEIGQHVMQELRQLDKVAYVRFASVYRHFRDIGEFMTELEDLIKSKDEATASQWMTTFRARRLSSHRLVSSGDYYVRVKAQTRPRLLGWLWPWNPGAVLGSVSFRFRP